MAWNRLDTPQEYAIAIILGMFILVIFVWPIKFFFNPKPKNYVKFITDARNVTVKGTKRVMYWVQHYFSVTFVSSFLNSAVHTTLHYPLLITKLNCSILEVGCVDALSQLLAAMLDLALKYVFNVRHLGRSFTFLFHTALISLGYALLIGVLTPHTSKPLGIGLVILGQVAAGLNLSLAELGVMRNDAKEDIQNDSDVKYWNDSYQISSKLGQFQVVLRYPSTLLAASVFGPFIAPYSPPWCNVFSAYIIVGVLYCLLGLWLALCWRGFNPHDRSGRELVPKSSDLRHLVFSRYKRCILQLGAFNAVTEVVRNGYTRMVNLVTLSQPDIPNADIFKIICVVFAVSTCFFWMSDISSQSEARYVDLKLREKLVDKTKPLMQYSVKKISSPGKRVAPVLAFILMGCGHFILGRVASFNGMMSSAIVFGLGQAVSTGLRTTWVDEFRALMREEDIEEHQRKAIIRILGSLATTLGVFNSLVLGILGDHYGMQFASIFYSFIALLGGVLAWRMDLSVDSFIWKSEVFSFRQCEAATQAYLVSDELEQ